MNDWSWLTLTGATLHLPHPDFEDTTFCRWRVTAKASLEQQRLWLKCKNCRNSESVWKFRHRRAR
jgi:hypothetical protein